jgi:hypothetical protein
MSLVSAVVSEKISAVQLEEISELWMQMKTLWGAVHWVLVVTVLRPVAKRRPVETKDPSACATVVCNVCGLAIALHVCD